MRNLVKEFPYQDNYPIIEVEVLGPKRKLKIKALIDSGADYSLFGAQIAKSLGIPLEKGKRMTLSGIGGNIIGFLSEIPIIVSSYKFDCKIIFSDQLWQNINLLGRKNFFSPFLITFNEKLQKILIEKH